MRHHPKPNAKGVVALAVATLAIGATWACKTPSFPLPPPDPEQLDIEPYSQQGFMLMTGGPGAVGHNAEVRIFNDTKGFGYFFYADDEGAFRSPPVAADPGDRMQFSYRQNGDSSRPMCFIVDYDATDLPLCQ